MELIGLVVFPVCGDESALSVVKNIHDTLMKREPGAEDGRGHDFGVPGVDHGRGERSGDFLLRIIQGLAQFISEDAPYSLKVETEAETVFLDFPITYLRDDVAESRIGLSQVDNFHGFERMVTETKIKDLFQLAQIFRPRCFLSGQIYPVVGEAEVAVVADDNMIEQGDIESPGGVLHSRCLIEILFPWQGIA